MYRESRESELLQQHVPFVCRSFVVFLRTTPQRPTTPTAAVIRASLLSNLQVLPATPAVFHRRPGHHYEHVPATQLMDGKGVFLNPQIPNNTTTY